MSIWNRLVAFAKWINEPGYIEQVKPVEWSYFDKAYEKKGTFYSYYKSKKPYPHQLLRADLVRYIELLTEMSGPKEGAKRVDWEPWKRTEVDELYLKYFQCEIPELGPLQSIDLHYGKGWAIANFSYYEMEPKPECRRMLKFAIMDPSVAVQFRLMMD
jgi:hypothetical protein